MGVGRLVLVLAAFVVVCYAVQEPVTKSVLSKSLQRELLSRERVAVWVHFTDKDCASGSRFVHEEIGRDESEGFKKSLERRARMSSRLSILDQSPCDEYVSGVRAVFGAGQVRQRSRWLNAISVDVDVSSLEAVCSLPFVRECDSVKRSAKRLSVGEVPDMMLDEANSAQQLPYGAAFAQAQQLKVPEVHELGFMGQGITILMVDTGFETYHPYVASTKVQGQHDFLCNQTFVSNWCPVQEQLKHGTATFSCIGGSFFDGFVGTAPNATFVLAKTEDVTSEYAGEEDLFVSAVEEGERKGVQLLSTSLGYSFERSDGKSSAVTKVVDIAVELGMIVVASAGNAGSEGVSAPGDAHLGITVGAVDSKGSITSFSSRGPTVDGRLKPDIVALGYKAAVAKYNSTLGTVMSGTSFSCPISAGMIASVLSKYPYLTPFELRAGLLSSSDRAFSPDNDYGFGLPDAMKMMEFFEKKHWYGPSLLSLGQKERGQKFSFPFVAVDSRIIQNPSDSFKVTVKFPEGTITDGDTSVWYGGMGKPKVTFSKNSTEVEFEGSVAAINRKLPSLIFKGDPKSCDRVQAPLSYTLIASSSPAEESSLKYSVEYVNTTSPSSSSAPASVDSGTSWSTVGMWILRFLFIIGSILVIAGMIGLAVAMQRVPALQNIQRRHNPTEEFVRLQEDTGVWDAEMRTEAQAAESEVGSGALDLQMDPMETAGEREEQEPEEGSAIV